jgi:hypothetical protein
MSTTHLTLSILNLMKQKMTSFVCYVSKLTRPAWGLDVCVAICGTRPISLRGHHKEVTRKVVAVLN